MTERLRFHIEWEPMESGEPEERATCASLGIFLHDRAITRVEDSLAKTTRNAIRVAAYPLAIWFASNWWRLRWEGRRQGHEWAMAHKMSAAGGGYVWPNLTIVSGGDYIRLESQETMFTELEPISYLGNVQEAIPAQDFVAATDAFVETVLARLNASGLSRSDLDELWSLVQRERRDPSQAAYRRLEAILGFNAEEGPADRIVALMEAGERLGIEAVAEAAAGSADEQVLHDIEDALEHGESIAVGDLSALREHVRNGTNFRYPWQHGEVSARKVREALGLPNGPVGDGTLEDWLSLEKNVLKNQTPHAVAFAAALREADDSSKLCVAFRSRWHRGRRFEIARLVADHLLLAAPEDRLIPATSAQTARQQAQRAFAAEFLLPLDDLLARLGDTPDDEESIEEIANEYDVSPRLVVTRLAAKGLLSGESLMLPGSF